MNAITIASVPAKMVGFPVIKIAEVEAKKDNSAQLQEWLECQDFIVSAKAHSAGMLPVNVDSLRHFGVAAQYAFSVAHYNNEMIAKEMAPAFVSIFKASEVLENAAEKVAKKVKPALEQLRAVLIQDKREVMRYMQIIPAAIAAAYVGVSEHALNQWNNYAQVFGASYAGSHCYSLEEAKMIANNRKWIYNTVDSDDFRITAPNDEKSLDEVVMVDCDVASAFTGLTHSELRYQLPRNQLAKRPYRLSDLEKIRVAKLNGTY